jgi:hypothetical protein
VKQLCEKVPDVDYEQCIEDAEELLRNDLEVCYPVPNCWELAGKRVSDGHDECNFITDPEEMRICREKVDE